MFEFIAILKESLWATLATRLLYFEILGVLLILLLLAPASYTEQVRYEVVPGEIRQPVEAAKYWVIASQRPRDSAAKVLWDHLPPQRQEQLTLFVESAQSAESGSGQSGSGQSGVGQSGVRQAPAPGQRQDWMDDGVADFIEALNYLITEQRLWEDPFWEEQIDSQKTRDLWERRDSLSEPYLKRLNRMLVQEAFRAQVPIPPESVASLTYAGYEGQTLMMSGLALEAIIRDWLPFLLDKLFLTLGLLLAILVTAPMIPQMLEEGSLYLLLSKPISRVFLLLTKFIGSGLLILIISSIFLTGLWLILGFRFGVWMIEILWCIPLAVTIFLVYFSITVMAGLVFRNAILAIMATLFFACMCYFFSFSRYTYSGVVALQRTSEISVFGQQVVRRTTQNQLKILDGNENAWKSTFMQYGSQMPPEVYEPMSVLMPMPRGADHFYWPSRGLIIGEIQAVPPQPSAPKKMLAARADRFRDLLTPRPQGPMPPVCAGFFVDSQDQLWAVSTFGMIYRLNEAGQRILNEASEGKSRPAPATLAASTNPGLASDADRSDPVPTSEEKDAEELAWLPAGTVAFDGPSNGSRFAVDPTNDNIFVLGRSSLSRARRLADGNYHLELSVAFPWDWTYLNRTPIAWLDGKLLLPLRGRELLVIDAQQLSPVAEFRLPDYGAPLSIAVSRELGKAVIAYTNGSTWLYDSQAESLQRLNVTSEPVTGVAFNEQQQLVLARGVDGLTVYDVRTNQVVESLQPSRGLVRLGYDWFINPIYQIFPKPNECYVLIQHWATYESSDPNREQEVPDDTPLDIDTLQVDSDDPWAPIRSSVIFAALVMLFNCIYFSRQEF